MPPLDRRRFLIGTTAAVGAAAAATVLPPVIRKALMTPAFHGTGTIEDVAHVVILMLENRSFNHYFGTLRGVRGFGDRFPIPLQSGKPVWFQSDGAKDIPPYHLDSTTTSALLVPPTPHTFSDAQAAWNQGKFGHWPKYKQPHSMGHYRREDIPFQFALAEAFTICDAYHCSVTTGTDPNRIMFWSGSNFDPRLAARGVNCTAADSEPDNLRCWIKGALPDPGYTYAGPAFTWPTIPDVLEQAGISWRIYQDPNDNWDGAMHGGLAFESFRNAAPDSPLYRNGMTHWSLDDLADHVKDGSLPQVSWILPSKLQSEHPGAPSSPVHGADFTTRVLEALTADPAVWGRTVLFLTFDENDGQFDHVPPPAVPSWNRDGVLAGKSTVPLDGQYFSDPERKHLLFEDIISGNLRPWGLGPRVPMYVISPWSKGGWVNSQVFDHTSVGMFLERRFGIVLDSISPWRRAVCGDLTSAFDFAQHDDPSLPRLPDCSDFAAVEARQRALPAPVPPMVSQPLFQERGTRYSRALPYDLQVDPQLEDGGVRLAFANNGRQGAVFHVYDMHHLDRIPRRYTVESGKALVDRWDLEPGTGAYDLRVYGPNGWFRKFAGTAAATALLLASCDRASGAIRLWLRNVGAEACTLSVRAMAYRDDGPWTLVAQPGQHVERQWTLDDSAHWYDFAASAEHLDYRFAGRVETGRHGSSDPAMGTT